LFLDRFLESLVETDEFIVNVTQQAVPMATSINLPTVSNVSVITSGKLDQEYFEIVNLFFDIKVFIASKYGTYNVSKQQRYRKLHLCGCPTFKDIQIFRVE
jgi:hypothetical protein